MTHPKDEQPVKTIEVEANEPHFGNPQSINLHLWADGSVTWSQRSGQERDPAVLAAW